MKSKLILISSVCIGGFNDTMMYDTVIEYLGRNINIEIDKIWDDRNGKDLWKIETNLNLNYDTKKAIIENIAKDMPSIYSDVEPKKYYIDIFIEDKVKTIQEWNQSEAKTLIDYLHIGDKVDKSMADYFVESNPITCNGELVQLGGAYSSDMKGRNTYLTIAKDEPFGEWIYKGACLKGETINREYEFEIFDMNYRNKGLEEEKEL